MCSLIQSHLEEALKQIKRHPRPVALSEYISKVYEGNRMQFAHTTGRSINSVRHQVNRGAIYYKGKIYCPVKGE